MNWEAVKPTRKAWNRREGYELRLTNKTIGYLNANAREFLFDGKRAGVVRFEREGGDGNFSLVPSDNGLGLKVNENGHIALSAFTWVYPLLPLPTTLLLSPFEDEKRLVIAGVRK
jgi:hypothetical protein